MILETPWDFDFHKVFNNYVIKYSDVQEIVQGGPLIGKLSVNNKSVGSDLFGGPCLYDEGRIYLPLYIRQFLNNGFRLCSIDLFSLNLTILTAKERLIYIDRIEKNKLVYYLDIDKRKMKYCII